MKRGKKYTSVKEKALRQAISLDEAVKKIASLSTSKFNGKVEIHASLNLNEKERKQPVRGSIVYKNPIGKVKKVLVFADPLHQDIAKEAGADYYGLEDLITKIKDGWIDFDVAIATPTVMPKIAVLGRILGTKGLMPNPKTGTVTEDVKAAITSYKGGKIDFKTDDTGVMHSIVGTVATAPDELKENILKILRILIQNTGKPELLALKTIYIAPTMGPSIKISLDSILKEL